MATSYICGKLISIPCNFFFLWLPFTLLVLSSLLPCLVFLFSWFSSSSSFSFFVSFSSFFPRLFLFFLFFSVFHLFISSHLRWTLGKYIPYILGSKTTPLEISPQLTLETTPFYTKTLNTFGIYPSPLKEATPECGKKTYFHHHHIPSINLVHDTLCVMALRPYSRELHPQKMWH